MRLRTAVAALVVLASATAGWSAVTPTAAASSPAEAAGEDTFDPA